MKYLQYASLGVFLVFLFLKLAEMGQVAHWSWWWVTLPLWAIPAGLIALSAVLVAVALICKGVVTLLK